MRKSIRRRPRASTARTRGQQWEKVGVCGIDSGMIWIGDPSYCVTPDADNHPAETWEEFCEQIADTNGAKQFDYDTGIAGLGVCVKSGHGDGVYPVYVRRDAKGRVMEARIVFELPE